MNRASLLANIPRVLKYLKLEGHDEAAGQASLFGPATEETLDLVELPELSLAQRLDDERRLLGGFFSGHPVTSFAPNAAATRTHTIRQRVAMEQAGTSARIVVVGLIRRYTPYDRGGSIEIEDETGAMFVRLFAREAERYQWILKRDTILAIRLTPRYDVDRTTLVLQEAKKVGELKAEKPGKVRHARK